jgi:hypothetical protein
MAFISAAARAKLRTAFKAGATPANAARLAGVSAKTASRYAEVLGIKFENRGSQHKGSLVLPVYEGPTWIGKR